MDTSQQQQKPVTAPEKPEEDLRKSISTVIFLARMAACYLNTLITPNN